VRKDAHVEGANAGGTKKREGGIKRLNKIYGRKITPHFRRREKGKMASCILKSTDQGVHHLKKGGSKKKEGRTLKQQKRMKGKEKDITGREKF